jgi:hypothetical protein
MGSNSINVLYVASKLHSYYGILFGHKGYLRFVFFTAVTMKNFLFWDVTSCGSCKNRRFR